MNAPSLTDSNISLDDLLKDDDDDNDYGDTKWRHWWQRWLWLLWWR
jgi:hypothetical protein